jgi:hypothetical protein
MNKLYEQLQEQDNLIVRANRAREEAEHERRRLIRDKMREAGVVPGLLFTHRNGVELAVGYFANESLYGTDLLIVCHRVLIGNKRGKLSLKYKWHQVLKQMLDAIPNPTDTQKAAAQVLADVVMSDII